jgi:hypothetical protein
MYRFWATLSRPTVPFTSKRPEALSGEGELGPLVLLFGRMTGRRKSAGLGGGHGASRMDEGARWQLLPVEPHYCGSINTDPTSIILTHKGNLQAEAHPYLEICIWANNQ